MVANAGAGVNTQSSILGDAYDDEVQRLKDELERVQYEKDRLQAEKQPAPSLPQKIVKFVQERATLWHDAEGNPYASIAARDSAGELCRLENYRVDQSAFENWVRASYGSAHTKAGQPYVLKSSALTEAIDQLTALALFASTPELVPCLRVGGAAADKLYFDLGQLDWEAVEVTHTGWSVVRVPDVPFIRPKGMRPLPRPVRGAGPIRESLGPFVNVRPDDFVLYVGTLLGMFMPRGPYPVVCVFGQQDSAKTTVCRVLRRLYDPQEVELAKMPKQFGDVLVLAQHTRLTAYENVSSISPDLSDVLCQLSTGAGDARRSLYTNGEPYNVSVCRPVLINGIMEGLSRADLNDRAVVFNLPKLGWKAGEREFWERFDEARPVLLGRLLDGVVGALAGAHKVEVDTKKLRLVDFARWAEAGCRALGFEPGEFEKAFIENRRAAGLATLEQNPVAAAVMISLGLEGPFLGTVTGLLERLERCAANAEHWIRTSKAWPHSPKGLSVALRRIAPLLLLENIEIEFELRLSQNEKNGVSITTVGGRRATKVETGLMGR